jgi:hypothetical protein
LRLFAQEVERLAKILEGFVVIDAQRLNPSLGGDALFPNPRLLLAE